MSNISFFTLSLYIHFSIIFLELPSAAEDNKLPKPSLTSQ